MSQVIPSLGTEFVKLLPHKIAKNLQHCQEELSKIESEGMPTFKKVEKGWCSEIQEDFMKPKEVGLH